jgi:hypothetical protein
VWLWLSFRNEARADRANHVDHDLDAYAAAIEAARRDRAVGLAGLAVGGALVTAGIIHYVRRDRGRVEVTPFVRGDGGGLALAGGF